MGKKKLNELEKDSFAFHEILGYFHLRKRNSLLIFFFVLCVILARAYLSSLQSSFHTIFLFLLVNCSNVRLLCHGY